MRYGEYGRMRDSRGRYRGRRGYGYIDDMSDGYENYSESKENYRRGNYGAEHESMKSLDYMLKSVCQFMKMLKDEADSKEEIELIEEYARKIGEL